jgi:hypothetical protein
VAKCRIIDRKSDGTPSGFKGLAFLSIILRPTILQFFTFLPVGFSDSFVFCDVFTRFKT